MSAGHRVTPVDVPAETEDLAGTELLRSAADVSERLGDARIWHVSSTSTGGGVAELLWSSIAYHRDLGLPARWLVANAEPAFFDLTKRIHHGLHGRGAGAFTPADEKLYRSVTAHSAAQLREFVGAGDVVVLHDPQTVGTAPALLAAGAHVAWRCHIGTGGVGSTRESTWEFLRPYLEPVPVCVFTVPDFAPDFLASVRISVIKPSIDPRSPKNRELTDAEQRTALAQAGLVEAAPGSMPRTIGYTVHEAPLPPEVPVVAQVSRWDPLKDMTGVLRTFTEDFALHSRAHLVLAGPDPADIPDDPEGAAVFAEVRAMFTRLPAGVRERVHLVVLSLKDMSANAAVVNAIQRRATIVVQKSLEEGFGLTLTEAMWKARPVVASAVGGLLTQVTDKVTGLLVDPADYGAFAKALGELLRRPDYAVALGRAARRECEERFLVHRELGDYLNLYVRLADASS